MENCKQSDAERQNAEDLQGSHSLRIKSLREALFYYRDFSQQQNDEIVDLMNRLASLEEEKEKQVRALEAKQELMASQLAEKDRQLKEALAAKELGERKYSQLKVISDKMRADSNKHWQVRWNMFKTEVAAKEESLKKEHQQQVAQLKTEVDSLKEALQTQQTEKNLELMASQLQEKDQLLKEARAAKDLKEKRYNQLKLLSEKMRADNNKHWQLRWNMFKTEVAAKEESLKKEHQQRVSQLTAEKEALCRNLRSSEVSKAESVAEWEHRWGLREQKVKAEMTSLKERHRLEMLALTKTNQRNLVDLNKMKKRHAERKIKYKAVEAHLEEEVRLKRKASPREMSCSTSPETLKRDKTSGLSYGQDPPVETKPQEEKD